jgi:hypothetical protein
MRMPVVRRFSALIISFIVLAQFGDAQRVAIDSTTQYGRSTLQPPTSNLLHRAPALSATNSSQATTAWP